MLNKEWFCNSSDTKESDMTLFCFPFAGGNGEWYLPWKLKISKQVAVIPVQYPARSYRRTVPNYTRSDLFVADFIEQIKPFILTGKPFGFFGHSMGGYLVYCITRSLHEKNFPLPNVAFISSTPSPDLWGSKRSVKGMSDEDFNEIYLGLGGIQNVFLQYPEFMETQMKILRQDIEMVETCLCDNSTKLKVPIVSLGALDDHHVPSSSIEGWAAFTTQRCFSYSFEGGHFYIKNKQDQLLDIIETYTGKYSQQVYSKSLTI